MLHQPCCKNGFSKLLERTAFELNLTCSDHFGNLSSHSFEDAWITWNMKLLERGKQSSSNHCPRQGFHKGADGLCSKLGAVLVGVCELGVGRRHWKGRRAPRGCCSSPCLVLLQYVLKSKLPFLRELTEHHETISLWYTVYNYRTIPVSALVHRFGGPLARPSWEGPPYQKFPQ